MMADLDLAACRARLVPLLAEWSEEIVPARVGHLPHSTYSPRYGWMYAYEKGLKRRIERVLDHPLGGRERWLFGPDAPFSEGLANAFLHGNRHDPTRPIEVGTVVSRSGVAFSIRDGGAGFDAGAALAALGTGRAYFHVAGNGLRVLAAAPHVLASYRDGGTRLILLAEFPQRPSDVAQPPRAPV